MTAKIKKKNLTFFIGKKCNNKSTRNIIHLATNMKQLSIKFKKQ